MLLTYVFLGACVLLMCILIVLALKLREDIENTQALLVAIRLSLIQREAQIRQAEQTIGNLSRSLKGRLDSLN